VIQNFPAIQPDYTGKGHVADTGELAVDGEQMTLPVFNEYHRRIMVLC
jgi:hypothetical protein